MRVHLMGVGGAGVSALAHVFLARGDQVSGCDLKESDTTMELEDAGVLERRVLDTRPPRVEYRLTVAGRKLRVLVHAMRDYAGV